MDYNPIFDNGVGTFYTLDYPQTYGEVVLPRSADTISYTGYVRRLFLAETGGRGMYFRRINIGWEELDTTQFNIVQNAWLAISVQDHGDASLLDWTYQNPAGEILYHAIADVKDNQFQVTRFAGGALNTPLYQVHFTFICEETA